MATDRSWASGAQRALRDLAHLLLRQVRSHLLGFGILDAVYFVMLYTFGSYFLIDTPLNFLLFALYFHLVTSSQPSRRRIALFVMLTVLATLAASGLLITVVPRVSPSSVYLRILHQTAARYGILILTPYLIFHFRTPLTGTSRGYRVSTRVGWLLLKISLWSAAIPALLSIRGDFTVIHVPVLLLSIPFLAHHVVVPVVRRRRGTAGSGDEAPVEVQPFSVFGVGSARMVAGAMATALALVAIASVLRMPGRWQNYGSPDFMLRSTIVEFLPSPASTAGGVAFHPEYLGESNGCGQEPCHPRMFQQWVDSPHRNATSESYRRDLERVVRQAGIPAGRLCAGCHDPIALFSGSIQPGAPLQTPESLRDGISCLACHGLEAASERPGNGSNRFHFPPSYYIGPVSLPTLVGNWREHRSELHAARLGDDRICVGCHRFLPLGSELESLAVLADWLQWPVHEQPRRRSECLTERGCIGCHMPSIGENEKPWEGGLPLHHFDLDRMRDGRYEVERVSR